MISETEATANLREAHEILASLVNKRFDHEKKLAELGRERATIAFDAHNGDVKSRKRLDSLHLECAKADSEFLSLDAAVSTAQERVKDAEHALAKAHKAGKAQEILSLLPALRKHGEQLDEAARSVLKQYAGLQDVIRQIRTLSEPQYDDGGVLRHNSPVPSEALLRTSCRRVLIAALTGTDLEFERLAPAERHSGSELANGWAERAHAWASRVMEGAA